MARQLGVPVIMANKAGPWETPLPGRLPDVRSFFPGFSHIADSAGCELARVPTDYKTFAIFEYFGRPSYQCNKRRVELARRAIRENAR